MLATRFPMDAVEPVAKGKLGADVVHRVNATIGSPAGIILWELKRTKVWSDGWLPKLREDQRRCGADVALIISQTLPKYRTLRSGRQRLGRSPALRVARRRGAAAVPDRDFQLPVCPARPQTKMEQVYHYLTGTKFRQRVEAVIEKFEDMRGDLDREPLLTQSLPKKRVGLLISDKLLKRLALPRGIEPLFQP